MFHVKQQIEKISERQRLIRALNRADRQIREAFRIFIESAQSEATYRKIRQAIGSGDVEAALRIVDGMIADFAQVKDRVFEEVGGTEAKAAAAAIGMPAAAVAFDVRNVRAASIIERSRLALIRQMQDEQRAAIRNAITRQFAETGASPRATSLAIVRSIGLTTSQEQAVANYRRLLEQGSAQALQRQLRDRRRDRTIARSLATDTPLPDSTIDAMVNAYRNNYLRYRAETIARTESTRTANQAKQEANAQVIDAAGVDRSKVIRIWHATLDGRVRDAHADMDNQEVGLDEPFIDGSGNPIMYPGDPSAPAETTINCRCTFSLRVID